MTSRHGPDAECAECVECPMCQGYADPANPATAFRIEGGVILAYCPACEDSGVTCPNYDPDCESS